MCWLQGPVLLASSQGGMDIEEVARDAPDTIVTEPVDIFQGLTQEKADKVAKAMGFTDEPATQVSGAPVGGGGGGALRGE